VIQRSSIENGIQTVQVTLVDSKGVPCLDATNWISFSLAGGGQLIDDLGTSRGSRKVQAYDGRAIISIRVNGGRNVVGAGSKGLENVFLHM
jgi:beta-galactosidase